VYCPPSGSSVSKGVSVSSAWYIGVEDGEVEVDLDGEEYFSPEEALRLAAAIQNAAEEARRQ
jgi:hypothetical protein